MRNVINWFEIYVADFERAKGFYKNVFNCVIEDVPMESERHSLMKYATMCGADGDDGVCGALVQLDVAKPGVGGTLVYFESEEINAELSRVEAAGGKVIRPKLNIGAFGFIALIEDTEGNMVGMRSLK